jgi:hypothetical protein
MCIMVLFSHSVLGYNLQLLSVNGSSTTILWNGRYYGKIHYENMEVFSLLGN